MHQTTIRPILRNIGPGESSASSARRSYSATVLGCMDSNLDLPRSEDRDGRAVTDRDERADYRRPGDLVRIGEGGKHMVLLEAWKVVVVDRYAQFDGRARRPEFWWYVLINWIIGAVFGILGQASVVFSIIGGIYSLAVLCPGLAVGIRRLHDVGRSGWWVLLALIPIVGWIVLIVFCAAPSQ